MVKKRSILVVRDLEANNYSEMSLDRPVLTIGREETNDIVLDSRLVSRQHAEISLIGNDYVLKDLQSKNGTYVNGEIVTEPYVLKVQDEVQIADRFKLTFLGEETAPMALFKTRKAGVRIDKEGRRIWIDGEELDPPLSPAQYRLLELLYDNQGKVCSREEIITVVWPDEAEEGISEQAIDALVGRLRQRVGHQYIVTVRGHGFRLGQ